MVAPVDMTKVSHLEAQCAKLAGSVPTPWHSNIRQISQSASATDGTDTQALNDLSKDLKSISKSTKSTAKQETHSCKALASTSDGAAPQAMHSKLNKATKCTDDMSTATGDASQSAEECGTSIDKICSTAQSTVATMVTTGEGLVQAGVLAGLPPFPNKPLQMAICTLLTELMSGILSVIKGRNEGIEECFQGISEDLDKVAECEVPSEPVPEKCQETPQQPPICVESSSGGGNSGGSGQQPGPVPAPTTPAGEVPPPKPSPAPTPQTPPQTPTSPSLNLGPEPCPPTQPTPTPAPTPPPAECVPASTTTPVNTPEPCPPQPAASAPCPPDPCPPASAPASSCPPSGSLLQLGLNIATEVSKLVEQFLSANLPPIELPDCPAQPECSPVDAKPEPSPEPAPEPAPKPTPEPAPKPDPVAAEPPPKPAPPAPAPAPEPAPQPVEPANPKNDPTPIPPTGKTSEHPIGVTAPEAGAW